MKAILILNAGSSSLKFALFPMTPRLADLPQLSGQVEGIGAEPLMHAKDTHTGERFTENLAVPDGTDQNGQTARQGVPANLFTEKDASPENAKYGNKEGDGQRRCRADIDDQPKIEHVGDTAAEDSEGND